MIQFLGDNGRVDLCFCTLHKCITQKRLKIIDTQVDSAKKLTKYKLTTEYNEFMK